MSSEFVRYAPEIETIDPNIDELLARIIDFWAKKGRESPQAEGTGRAVRGAHAKAFGLVKAEVEIVDGVPAEYAQGIYSVPGRHGALIRFSSTSGHLGPDAQLGPGLGCAIKIFDVDGPKLVEDEPDSRTFDLVLKNNPIFISNTAKHYLFIQEIGNDVHDYLARGPAGFHELLTDLLTGKGTLPQSDWAWDELLAFVRIGDADTGTQSAAQHVLEAWARCVTGTTWRRFVSRRPRRMSGTRSTTSSTSPAARTSSARPWWTSCGREPSISISKSSSARISTAMPVNVLTVEWSETRSPFVTVARVRLPRQDISGPENFEKGDALAFNQWRVTSDHRPLGEIMNVRRIYSTSAWIRRKPQPSAAN